MTKITVVSSYLLHVPTDKLITDSIHSLEQIEVIVCKIWTDDDICGEGLTYTIGSGGSSIKAFIDDYLARIIIGRDPSDINSIWESMWWLCDPVGRGGITTYAMAAVDIALWDIMGKSVEKPLHWLLGGSGKPVPLYETNSGWLHYDIDELVQSAINAKNNGFHGFKLKVGKKDANEDLKRIRAVIDAVGNDISVMIDANQAWDYPEALRRGRLFQTTGIEWYEEPCSADDLHAHALLSEKLNIPIAVGETIFTKYEFAKYINAGAVSVSQHDVCRVGGITEWMQISHLALSNHVRVSPHFVMQLHAPLVSSIQNGMYVEHIPWMNKLFDRMPKVEHGLIYPSAIAGNGLKFSEGALNRYLVQ